MDTNKKIVKALLEKNYVDAKESVFKSLYAKASVLMDEERVKIAADLFAEAKGEEAEETQEEEIEEAAKTTGVPAGASEDKFTAARAEIKKAGHKAKLGKGVPAGSMKESVERISTPNREFYPASKKTQARWKDEDTRKSGETWKTCKFGAKNKDNHIAYFKDEAKAKAWASSKTKYKKMPYFKDDPYIDESINSRTEVKEETEQLDEVSPPDMEKMTGSKHTKASFTKQYGKRGKEVMYATAWKQYNKKAND